SLVTAKLIKEQTGATIVLGGLTYPRPMVEFKKFFDTGYVDHIVRIHGEAAFLNICYGLEKGNINKLDIQGLLSKEKKDKNLIEPPFFPRRMTDFFRPNFDGLPLDLYKYSPTGKTKELSSKKVEVLMLPYIFVNGCPNNCIFCPLSDYEEYGMRNPELVAEDLKYLSKRYNTQYFFFINSNVNPTYDYAKKLVREFKKANLNIMWNDCANFRQIDTKLIKDLRDIGAVKLIYGLECPSDRILKYIRKGITVKRAEKILKISHEAGIWNEIELIAGLPYERTEDTQSCVNFIDKNKNYLDYMYLGKFILKNSLLYKNPKKYGLTNVSNNISNIYDMGEFTRRYDEINGLKWDKKYKQINYSFEKVHGKVSSVLNEKDQKYDPTKHMPLLFYLYTVLDSKQEIRDHFKQCYFDYTRDVPNKTRVGRLKKYLKGYLKY
ncbi:MAG: radical SAM protein, partial [Nanoarchaeota archaeon]|nr:radical SAM protein [Nanoarchaeota archaeon]